MDARPSVAAVRARKPPIQGIREVFHARFGERIRTLLGQPPADGPVIPRRDLAEHLRAFLDARLSETPTIGAAAEQLGVGPTRLTRAFSEVFGIAPHTYVLARRIDAARDMILAGLPLADVAAAVGFHDQAHLTLRFKRFLGVTPGTFARSRGRPTIG